MGSYLGVEMESEQLQFVCAKQNKGVWKVLKQARIPVSVVHEEMTYEEQAARYRAQLEKHMKEFLKGIKGKPIATGICIPPEYVWRRAFYFPNFNEAYIEDFLRRMTSIWNHVDTQPYMFTGEKMVEGICGQIQARSHQHSRYKQKNEEGWYCIMGCQRDWILSPYEVLEKLRCKPKCVTTVVDTLLHQQAMGIGGGYEVLFLEKMSTWYVAFYESNVCTFVQRIKKEATLDLILEWNKIYDFYRQKHTPVQLDKVRIKWLHIPEGCFKEELEMLLQVEVVEEVQQGPMDEGLRGLLDQLAKKKGSL
ncbi:MAG: hypothetical protein RR582_04510 [Niameybacter sp.]